jgi:probable HAF family extracellular repeat protein
MRFPCPTSVASVVTLFIIAALAAPAEGQQVEALFSGHAQVRDGSLESYSLSTATMNVVASGGVTLPHGGGWFSDWLCNPCYPGATIDLIQFIYLSGSGTATGDNAAYIGIDIRGKLEFQGPSVAVPATGTPVFTVPFTVSGFLTGFSGNQSPLFHRQVLGFGTATIRLRSLGSGPGAVYTFDSADYRVERFLSSVDLIVPDIGFARAVNQSGEVAGDHFQLGAFKWSEKDGLSALGFDEAYAINASGSIVGSSVWKSNGTVSDVGVSLRDINDAGVAVGQCEHGTACVWSEKGGVVDLEPLLLQAGYMGSSHAYAINNRGDILLRATRPEGIRYLLLRANGQIREFASGEPLAINSHGVVSGQAWIDGRMHAVVWTPDGRMIELGLPPGWRHSGGAAINDRGDVVGWAGDQLAESRAFVWTSSGSFRDLGPGYGAFGINNSGMIVGSRAVYGVWIGDYEAFTWQLAPPGRR